MLSNCKQITHDWQSVFWAIHKCRIYVQQPNNHNMWSVNNGAALYPPEICWSGFLEKISN